MKKFTPLAAALLASGCAGLSAQRADLAAFQDSLLPETPSDWAVSLPEPAAQSDWISQFQSNVLNDLVEEAMRANPDIAAAAATARAARANYAASRGRALPQVNASSRAEYGGLVDSFDDGSEAYNLGATASWEPDLWGRVSRAIDFVEKDLEAAEEDLKNARLSIAGAVARGWISLVNARAQLSLARDDLRVREASERVTERRLSAGVATALDVRLARSATASTKASIASAQNDVADAARSLEILLGRYPAAAIDAPDTPPQLGPMPSLSSPTELLARRPDISAAEARMASSGLVAELARLELQPKLSLSASLSVDSDEIGDLIDVEKLFGRVLANLTAPIFSGGTLRAEADRAYAQAEAAAANYASAVLNAWREVESAREADIHLADQEAALAEALDQAEAAEILAERQYQNGLISIFNLIDAQSRRISSERQLLNVRASRAANRITYHIALGGGDLNVPGATIDERTAP